MAPPGGEDIEWGDNVDEPTFEQILDMDDEDDDTREFSKGIVFDFFAQAELTFQRMDDLIKNKDLEGLAGQGHFLKGSSATLGFTHLKDACEKIQHYGHMEDESGANKIDDRGKCLDLIKESLQDAKDNFKIVKKLMEKYYNVNEE